jgi:hypothetical protein
MLPSFQEIDPYFSPTDFKNVSIVGHYVKDRTKDAQFIIIRYSPITLQIFLLPVLHTVSRTIVVQTVIWIQAAGRDAK